jgi:uncharacterized delta-60 repeat protein
MKIGVGGAGILVGLLTGSVSSILAARAGAQDTQGSACSDWAEAVAVDAAGRTLVGGTTADNRILEWDDGHAHYGDLALTRLLPSGQTDVGFGVSGSVIVDVSDFDGVNALLPTAAGVIVAGRTSQRDDTKSGPNDLVLLRVDEQGHLVESFGSSGVARFDFGGSASAAGLARAWGGAVYIAGTIEHPEAPSEGFIARVAADGKLDDAYGADGIVRFELEGEDVRFFAIRSLWDSVVVGGQASHQDSVSALVLRLDGLGQFVPDYGVAGVARYDLVRAGGSDGGAALSLTGKAAISLSLAAADGASQIATVSFDRHGVVVPSAEGEVSLLDVPGGTQDSASAAGFRGRNLYLAGSTYAEESESGDAFVARLTPNGALDPKFAGGINTEHLDLEYTAFNDLAVRTAGVTVAGWNFGEKPHTLPPSDGLVVRYHFDGTLDETFGQDGIVLVDFRHGARVCGPRVDVE